MRQSPNHVHIPQLRLAAQAISTPSGSVADAVRHMGALQAQDYPASLWAIRLRAGATKAEVDASIARREIVRSWPMRGTLHFVPSEDLRWMLELCTPRIIGRTTARDRQLELDDAVFTAAGRVIEVALAREGTLTRPAVYETLEAAGISPAGQRGIHIIGRLAQQGLICFGPHVGKQPAFVLTDAWLPTTPALTAEEASARLAHRYFVSHGPATVHDFAWWSNLTLTTARAALAAVRDSLECIHVSGKEYWLAPGVARPDRATTSSHDIPRSRRWASRAAWSRVVSKRRQRGWGGREAVTDSRHV